MDAMIISITSSAENDGDVDDVVVRVGSRRHVDAMLLFLDFRKYEHLCNPRQKARHIKHDVNSSLTFHDEGSNVNNATDRL